MVTYEWLCARQIGQIARSSYGSGHVTRIFCSSNRCVFDTDRRHRHVLATPIASVLFSDLSNAHLLFMYAGRRVANSSSKFPYFPSGSLLFLCQPPLTAGSAYRIPLLSRLDRRCDADSRTFLRKSWRTGWIVGRHAQIIPMLISTLDQIIEAAASSDHVSASGDCGIEILGRNKHNGSVSYLHEKSEALTSATVYARAILAPQILRERPVSTYDYCDDEDCLRYLQASK